MVNITCKRKAFNGRHAYICTWSNNTVYRVVKVDGVFYSQRQLAPLKWSNFLPFPSLLSAVKHQRNHYAEEIHASPS